MTALKTSSVALKEELSKPVTNRIVNNTCNNIVTHINDITYKLDMTSTSKEHDEDGSNNGGKDYVSKGTTTCARSNKKFIDPEKNSVCKRIQAA